MLWILNWIPNWACGVGIAFGVLLTIDWLPFISIGQYKVASKIAGMVILGVSCNLLGMLQVQGIWENKVNDLRAEAQATARVSTALSKQLSDQIEANKAVQSQYTDELHKKLKVEKVVIDKVCPSVPNDAIDILNQAARGSK